MTDASYFFPGQLFQNPDGTFNLNITGHVHAAGLDLDAGVSSSPGNVDRVRWIRQSDGSVIATIYGYSSGGIESTVVLNQAAAAGDTSSVLIEALDDQNANPVALIVNQQARGTPPTSNYVQANALAKNVTLIDGGGRSSLLQLPGVKVSMLWSGAVAGATGTVRVAGSGAWSVSRTATGTYTLTLTGGPTGVWALPICVVNEASGSQPTIDVDYGTQSGGATVVTVKTVSDPLGLTDFNWSFVAIAAA